MKEFRNDKEIVGQITNEFWNIYSTIRGGLDTNDFDIFLLLLSAYKDGLIDQSIHNYYYGINSLLTERLESSDKYGALIPIYKPLLISLPENLVTFLLNELIRFNEEELKAYFPEIFDELLYKLSNAQGKRSGEFIQPIEVSRFIMNLANLEEDATVYNPFAGVASFATFLKTSQEYNGQEINYRTWALGALRLMAHNQNLSEYKIEDSVEKWIDYKGFDLIVSNPPFNMKLRNRSFSIESFIIEKSLHQLHNRGQLICIFPESFLFKKTKRDFEFKKYLIENNLIETIISLPNGIFKHTGIGTCIVIINRKKKYKNKIRFIDATSFIKSTSNSREKLLDDLSLLEQIESSNKKYVQLVDKETIIKNGYNLLTSRYYIDDNFKGVRLQEITNLIRGARSEKAETGKVVKIKDLKNDIVNYNLDISEIEEKEVPEFAIRKIQQSCLLVALKWRTLKPTYFEYNGEPIYISTDISAIRFDKKMVNISYLINELHADYVLSQLDGLRLSGIIPTLRSEDFFQVKVKLPSVEEQNKKYLKDADQYLKTIVSESRESYNSSVINVEDENSFLRHQIAGSLKNIRGAFKFVQKIIEEQVKNQIPNLNEFKADNRLNTTFADYMNIIERDLLSINKAVNKAGDKIDLLDLNIEYFDLLSFLKEYTESLKIRAKNLFGVTLDLDENAIKEYGILGIQIHGDKDIIRKMIDNIIENAEKHAFFNSINSGNKIKIELLYDFEDSAVQIDISNTGKPLPKSVSHDSMIRKGSSIGENSGDGIGLWYVNEVMKVHKGKFGYTDETGPEGIDGEFVTTMELTLPIIQVL